MDMEQFSLLLCDVYQMDYGYMMILVYLTDGSRMIYDDLRKQAKMSA